VLEFARNRRTPLDTYLKASLPTRLRFVFATLCTLLAGIYCSLWVFQVWAESRKVTPAPENESVFFRTYHPEQVILRLYAPNTRYTWGTSDGGSSDNHFAYHSWNFQSDLVVRENTLNQVLHALDSDITRLFDTTNTRLLEKKPNPAGGFRYRYKSGRSVGFISVQPPQDFRALEEDLLPPGLEGIRVRIDIEEKWNELCIVECD
jgi:hypothetical protein